MYKKILNKFSRKKILLQRIETKETGIGVPDIFYRTWNQDGWIELKVLNKYPKRKNYIKVPFRLGQINWIKNYWILNGSIFLFLYIENALWIFKGDNIKEQYSELEIIKSTCYKAFWKDINWDNIYNLLDTNT